MEDTRKPGEIFRSKQCRTNAIYNGEPSSEFDSDMLGFSDGGVGGISDLEGVDDMYVPPYTMPQEKRSDTFSKQLYKLAAQHKVSREYYDSTIKVINEYISGTHEPLLSHYKSKNLLKHEYPVTPVYYDVCEKGCMMFLPSDGSAQCEACCTPRFKEDRSSNGRLKPRATVLQLPLPGQLRAILQNEDTRQDLLYRSTLPPRSPEVCTDIFDGDVCTTLLNEGCFTGDLDIALALYTERFHSHGQAVDDHTPRDPQSASSCPIPKQKHDADLHHTRTTTAEGHLQLPPSDDG